MIQPCCYSQLSNLHILLKKNMYNMKQEGKNGRYCATDGDGGKRPFGTE